MPYTRYVAASLLVRVECVIRTDRVEYGPGECHDQRTSR